jgi:single-stranded-DNA-specific exonuclease
MSVTTERPRWVKPAARWIDPRSQELAEPLAAALGLGRLAARLLTARGYSEAAAARAFLRPELNLLHDPWRMRGMEAAVERIEAAIRRAEPILLYGDYDVDGTCSVVVLKIALEALGARTDFFIPHRIQDGYGMRKEVIDRAAAEGVRLVISVDTGIRAADVTRHAAELGIDVIVTDHHIPDGELPSAVAVLNPHQPGCEYPNRNLCGAGVTFKLVEALLRRGALPEAKREALLESLLKPVAIATVADIVPLTDENRVIVKRGLAGLRNVRSAGLRALMRLAGLEEGEVPSAHQVAFRLAPRINAAGRMSTARSVIELLLTRDASRADALAAELDGLNRERQQVEASIVDSVLEQCEQAADTAERSALVFCGEEWHVGVLGIVASRLVERFCRPVFVLTRGTTLDEQGAPYLTGSGRSIPAFHLLESLESMPELFVKFGGHKQAAGLTLRAFQLEEFRDRFHAFAAGCLTEEDLRPQYQVDADASFSDFDERGIEQVLQLGPFGLGNPVPTFRCRDVEAAGVPQALGGAKHFKVWLRQGNRTLMARAWSFADRIHFFEPGARLDLLVQIEEDAYAKKQGYGSWCLSVKDVRKSEGSAP